MEPSDDHGSSAIEDVKAQRELFFWTAREVIATARQLVGLLIFVALAIWFVIVLAEDGMPNLTSSGC